MKLSSNHKFVISILLFLLFITQTGSGYQPISFDFFSWLDNNELQNFTTLMIGVEEEKEEQAMLIFDDQCAPASDLNQHTAAVFALYDNHFLKV